MTDTADLSAPPIPARGNLTPAGIPEGAPPETYSDLGKDYPLVLMAGGLGLGLLAGALLPRGAGRKLVRGAIAVAAVAGEAGQLYGKRILDVAEESRGTLEDITHTAGTYGRKVADAAGQSARKGREAGIKTVARAIRLVTDLRR